MYILHCLPPCRGVSNGDRGLTRQGTAWACIYLLSLLTFCLSLHTSGHPPTDLATPRRTLEPWLRIIELHHMLKQIGSVYTQFQEWLGSFILTLINYDVTERIMVSSKASPGRRWSLTFICCSWLRYTTLFFFHPWKFCNGLRRVHTGKETKIFQTIVLSIDFSFAFYWSFEKTFLYSPFLSQFVRLVSSKTVISLISCFSHHSQPPPQLSCWSLKFFV